MRFAVWSPARFRRPQQGRNERWPIAHLAPWQGTPRPTRECAASAAAAGALFLRQRLSPFSPRKKRSLCRAERSCQSRRLCRANAFPGFAHPFVDKPVQRLFPQQCPPSRRFALVGDACSRMGFALIPSLSIALVSCVFLGKLQSTLINLASLQAQFARHVISGVSN